MRLLEIGFGANPNLVASLVEVTYLENGEAVPFVTILAKTLAGLIEIKAERLNPLNPASKKKTCSTLS